MLNHLSFANLSKPLWYMLVPFFYTYVLHNMSVQGVLWLNAIHSYYRQLQCTMMKLMD